jgi:prepilin-type N-terminal cleavage/methylation domain-containing protein
MDVSRARIRPVFGFTLIEVVSVVAVILILAGVITVRLGDLRSAASTAGVRALEKEFAKAAEQLAAQGGLNEILGLTANGTLILQRPEDADFKFLSTSTYRLSSPARPASGRVTNVINGMNSVLSTRGLGLIRGSIHKDVLNTFNVDLIVVRDVGGAIHGVYLRLSQL